MCTVNITVTAITYHMYHSMYATHLNNTYTQIHITAQAIYSHDQTITRAHHACTLSTVIHIRQQLYNQTHTTYSLILYLYVDMCLTCILLINETTNNRGLRQAVLHVAY